MRNAAFIGLTELFLLHDRCSIQSVCQQEKRAGLWPKGKHGMLGQEDGRGSN